MANSGADLGDFAFCTLAFGATYRALAKQLVTDITTHCPHIPLVLYTDKPADFRDCRNVLLFKHKRQGVLCYHERRFAIAQALSMFRSCMYLDADVRLCAPIPETIQWQPGLTARSCSLMTKHIQERLHNRNQQTQSKILKTLTFAQHLAEKVGVDIEANQVMFINEFLFVVTRDDGREQEFLDLWGKLALYAELRGHHKHPTYAMGIAAAKTGFPVHYDVMPGIEFFDDRIEKVRIQQGQSTPDAKHHYFETQKRLEQRKRSLVDKLLTHAEKQLSYHYHLNRLRLGTLLSDRNFYYSNWN
jgi:hypothetical protein